MEILNEDFKKLVYQATDMITDWYDKKIRGSKIYNNKSPAEIRETFKIKSKNKGTSPSEVIKKLEKNLIEASNFNPSPNYYAYITGGGNQIGIIAEYIKAALNQNNLKWHSAPANSEIEKIVIEWISEFIGYNKKCGGVLVSGGSVANLMNIAVMRKVKGGKKIKEKGIYNEEVMRVYVSEEGHSSIDKAMDILGLGSENLIKIKKDKNFKIQINELEKQINLDIKSGFKPIGVIGIAGTTNTGSVDPMDKILKICKKFDLWFMVDAAYGGPAAGLKEYKNLFKGMEKADSILLNPHKWMFVPFEVACVLVKNQQQLKNTFSLIPEYLMGGADIEEREDLMNYSIQLSKDFKALKVWMTIEVFGHSTISKAIKNDIEMALYAYEKIKNNKLFKPLHKPELSIFCFKYISKLDNISDDLLNKKIIEEIEKDGRIFLSGTKINNENVLRINCINHRRKREDIDFLIKVLEELGSKAEKELSNLSLKNF